MAGKGNGPKIKALSGRIRSFKLTSMISMRQFLVIAPRTEAKKHMCRSSKVCKFKNLKYFLPTLFTTTLPARQHHHIVFIEFSIQLWKFFTRHNVPLNWPTAIAGDSCMPFKALTFTVAGRRKCQLARYFSLTHDTVSVAHCCSYHKLLLCFLKCRCHRNHLHQVTPIDSRCRWWLAVEKCF